MSYNTSFAKIDALLNHTRGHSTERSRSRGRSPDERSSPSRPLSANRVRSRSRMSSRGRSHSRDSGLKNVSDAEHANWVWSILEHDPSERFRELDGDAKIVLAGQEKKRHTVEGQDDSLQYIDADDGIVSEEEAVDSDSRDQFLFYDVFDALLPNYQMTLTEMFKEKSSIGKAKIQDKAKFLDKKKVLQDAAGKAELLNNLVASKGAILQANSDGIFVKPSTIAEVEGKLEMLGINPEVELKYLNLKKEDYEEYREFLLDKNRKANGKRKQIESNHHGPDLIPQKYPLSDEDDYKELVLRERRESLQEENIVVAEINTDESIPRATRTVTLGNFEEANLNKSFGDVKTYMMIVDSSEQSTSALQYVMGTLVSSGDVLFLIHCTKARFDAIGNEIQNTYGQRIGDHTKIVENLTRVVKKNMLLYHEEDFTLSVVIQSLHDQFPRHYFSHLVRYLKPVLVATHRKLILKDKKKSTLTSSFSHMSRNEDEHPILEGWFPDAPFLILRRMKKADVSDC